VIDENYESPLEDLDEMIMNEPREKEYENDIEKQIPQYKKSIQMQAKGQVNLVNILRTEASERIDPEVKHVQLYLQFKVPYFKEFNSRTLF
jgi:hypothetical protein